jgi:hypothetical protein
MNQTLMMPLFFVSIIASGLILAIPNSIVYAQTLEATCNSNGDIIVLGTGFNPDSYYNNFAVVLTKEGTYNHLIHVGIENPSANIDLTYTYEDLQKLNIIPDGGIVEVSVYKLHLDSFSQTYGPLIASIQFVYNCQPNPVNGIQGLLITIQSSSLDHGLGSPLKKSIQLLSDNNPTNDKAVCNQLNAFINQVDVDAGNGFIDHTKAQNLKSTATNIKTQMQCTA